MTSLIGKIVRSRSKHRRSEGSTDHTYQPLPDRTSFGDSRASADIPGERSPRTSESIAAWHVHRGGRPVSSSAAPADEMLATNTNAANQSALQDEYTLGEQQHDARRSEVPETSNVPVVETVPPRTSSLPQGSNRLSTESGRRRSRHDSDTYAGSRAPQDLAGRNRPIQRKAVGSADGEENNSDALAQRVDSLALDSDRDVTGSTRQQTRERVGSDTVNTSRHGHHGSHGQASHIPTAIASDRSAGHAHSAVGSNLVNEGMEHLRLPANFNLRNTERTTVDTMWKPAVTHEVVHNQRTEIIREAISRDIHVHHYYTYVQPIRVVEVLPARHFHLDQKTGIKKEIPAPLGWTLPDNMQPRQADLTGIRGSSRHYMVNEQYPEGIAEPAPADWNDEYHLPVNGHTLPTNNNLSANRQTVL